jgi:outer membrane protein OmpA-like peptidoglycan-associated protein
MFRLCGILLTSLGLAVAQTSVPNPTQQATAAQPTGSQKVPVFSVSVVSRTIKAINYHHRTGSTQVDLRGTTIMSSAQGIARVESKMGSTKIDTQVSHLLPASTFGPEFLTYVLWAITPEGRADNLGELALDGSRSKLLSTTELQTFGLIVTAEPYFAVTQPSDVVVMENFVRKDTTGTIGEVEAKYELLERGTYTMRSTSFQPVRIDPNGPLQLAEAKNAVQIAKLAGAETYAQDSLAKALIELKNAEGLIRHGNTRKQAESTAREATQRAEDARIITVRKLRAEELARERAAAAAREAKAKEETEAEAKRRAGAEAAAQLEAKRRAEAEAETQAEAKRRADAEAERLAAERAKLEAEEAARHAEQAKAEADAARAEALKQQEAAQAEAEKSRLVAEEANRLRLQAEKEKAELRQRLLEQLNFILETRDTARGLIVNMSDVLFDSGKYTLRPLAREKLAKISGIVLSHPGLQLEVEGHTDSIGGDEYNQRLSEQRAASVRDYLVSQGIPMNVVAARGFGKTQPVASNSTAEGRQKNRRVEMVVSGEVIGVQVRAVSSTPEPAPQQ